MAWPGPLGLLGPGPRALGVLNCYLVQLQPAVLRIFFRIGAVRGFVCVSGEFPVGLDGLDRLCRGGSGHAGFHLNRATERFRTSALARDQNRFAGV